MRIMAMSSFGETCAATSASRVLIAKYDWAAAISGFRGSPFIARR
jgi:hypothetical protein